MVEFLVTAAISVLIVKSFSAVDQIKANVTATGDVLAATLKKLK